MFSQRSSLDRMLKQYLPRAEVRAMRTKASAQGGGLCEVYAKELHQQKREKLKNETLKQQASERAVF